MLAHPDEEVRLDARHHGIALARPLFRALVFALVGAAFVALPWPAPVPGALGLAVAALLALRAVWRWERTRVVVTTETLFVVQGTLRRRASAVRLARIGAVDVEQGLLGRVLGYGTLIAGELEVPYVARPREVSWLVQARP